MNIVYNIIIILLFLLVLGFTIYVSIPRPMLNMASNLLEPSKPVELMSTAPVTASVPEVLPVFSQVNRDMIPSESMIRENVQTVIAQPKLPSQMNSPNQKPPSQTNSPNQQTINVIGTSPLASNKSRVVQLLEHCTSGKSIKTTSPTQELADLLKERRRSNSCSPKRPIRISNRSAPHGSNTTRNIIDSILTVPRKDVNSQVISI